MWQRYARNKLAVVGLLVIALYVAAAVAAPLLATHDPLAISLHNFAPPGAEHWLGTDRSGRDLYSRIVYGSRLSLSVAGGSVLFALTAGTLMGLIAGHFGGWIDMTISRLTDMMFSLPDIVMALVIMAILGRGLINIALAIGIVYTPIFARVCRGTVLRVQRQPYIEAAHAVGAAHRRIMLRHILPNAAGPLIVQSTLSFAFAILTEAAISFLGLSGQTDAPSWGLMLQRGKDAMQLGGWWLAVFPGLAITLAVLSFNLVGDGLQEVLTPRESS